MPPNAKTPPAGGAEKKGASLRSHSTTSTPDAQAVTCASCARFLSLPRRSLCRWSGEHVNASWPCAGCWGFAPLPLNDGGDAA